MSSKFDQLQREINKLKQENKQLKNDFRSLKQSDELMSKPFQQLESIAVKQKQENNANNMVITNMPKLKRETNVKDVVLKIAEQVDHPINLDEIIDAFQTENKNTGSFPIIVKLKSSGLKQKCMEFRKNKKQIELKRIANGLNNGEKNINFFHLIEKEIADRLNKAKDIAKKKNYKFVWYANSTILARKDEQAAILKIKCDNDLKLIK